MTSWILLAKKISDFAYLQQNTPERHGLEILPWKPRFDPARISRIGRGQYRELLLQDVQFYNELTRVRMQELKHSLADLGWHPTDGGMKWAKEDDNRLDFCDALALEFGEGEKNAWLCMCELEQRFEAAWDVFFFLSMDPRRGVERLRKAELTFGRRRG